MTGRRTGKVLERLDRALKRSQVPQLRFFAQVVMLVGQRARMELKRRGDAWRAAGLGSFATVEAVREAGL